MYEISKQYLFHQILPKHFEKKKEMALFCLQRTHCYVFVHMVFGRKISGKIDVKSTKSKISTTGVMNKKSIDLHVHVHVF